MNLLAGKLYDPAVVANKVTTALLAMTAIDTTNLRLAFVVPPSGMVYVRLEGSLHGATTFPQIMLGVLEGATVKGRVRPKSILGGTALATTMVDVEAHFVVTGLTPGASLNWDAAYGVETIVAATGLKYGGPNNTTANDAFGGFVFEIWDPCPLYTPTSGTAPPATIHVKADLIDDFVDAEVAAILAAVDTEVGAIKTKTDQLTFTAANKVDSTIQAAGDFAQGAADKVWVSAARTLTSFGTLIADIWASVTRTLTSSLDPTAAAIRAEIDSNSTALAVIAAYVDELETRLTLARAGLLDNLDAAVSSRSTFAGGAVASVVAVVNADLKKINGTAIIGDGAVTPFGP